MKPASEWLTQCLGQRVDMIDTPALVVDLDAMERNIVRMAEFARKHRLLWRPHAKLHKSVEIALLLQRAGATGACVQKLSEAQILAAGGVSDIFISNQIIALNKLVRLLQLAAHLHARGGRLAMAVDSLQGLSRIAQAQQWCSEAGLGLQAAPLHVFVEIDVGQGRCGVPPGPEALTLVRALAQQPGLRFAGLHAYQGKAQHLRSSQERHAAISAAAVAVAQTRALIEAAGVRVPLVTGSGTGTLMHEAMSGVYGELQPGSFLFMDADYAANEAEAGQPAFEQALFVKTQIISVCESHAVCDAGHKTYAIDSGMPEVYGLGPERALRMANGGDEHGLLYCDGPKARLPALGRMLWLIPGHCDPTVNLHDYLIGVRGGLTHGKVERLLRVDARGAVL